eukprot:scaffold88061_cov36-Tisochrysis_lutea.AAC.4
METVTSFETLSCLAIVSGSRQPMQTARFCRLITASALGRVQDALPPAVPNVLLKGGRGHAGHV